MTRVIWVDPDPHWDEEIIRELTAGPEFEHHFDGGRADDGAVVVIPGQHHIADVLVFADQIADLPWALTVVTGDEEQLFPVDQLPHDEKHLIWGQYHVRPEFDRVIPIGPPPDTIPVCVGERKPGVFFAGQDTHERRHELLAVMKEMACEPSKYGDVGWVATTGFREGLDRFDYRLALCATTLAPCPSGPHSLDSFRLYEALAAGCLPVVEMDTPHGFEGRFWLELFGDECPIPWVDSWHDLPALAEQYADPYEDHVVWRAKRDEVQRWYAAFREDLAIDFENTVRRLQS